MCCAFMLLPPFRIRDVDLAEINAFTENIAIPYQTAYAHLKGLRRVTPQQAVNYERVMGIPRTEFYPLSFWFPTVPAKALEDAE